MTHFAQCDMCEEPFDFMLQKITQHSSVEDISVFIVGGVLGRMRDKGNFFDFIEKYLKDKQLNLKQTFLGDKGRPTDLVFDCQEGRFYKLIFFNKGPYKFEVTDDRKDLPFSFRNPYHGRDVEYYYSSENQRSFIPVNISFL